MFVTGQTFFENRLSFMLRKSEAKELIEKLSQALKSG